MNSISIKTLNQLVSAAKPEETNKLREYAIIASNLSDQATTYTAGVYLRQAADWLEMVVDGEAFENYRTAEECLENALKGLRYAASVEEIS
jgi:hypothetical protein